MKLFATADGKIPFLQIIVGIIIGAISMFAYIKFGKPKFIFDDKSKPSPTVTIESTETLVSPKEKNTLKGGSPPEVVYIGNKQAQFVPVMRENTREIYAEELSSSEDEEEEEDEDEDQFSPNVPVV